MPDRRSSHPENSVCKTAPMWPRVNGFRSFGLGTPGEMRDRLSAFVLDGTKTATAGLWKVDYELGREAVEDVGERQVMLDSDGAPLAVIEVTRVESLAFAEVPWEFAAAEGEGFTTIDDWRRGHRDYYRGQGVAVGDRDLMICVWLKVVDPLQPSD